MKENTTFLYDILCILFAVNDRKTCYFSFSCFAERLFNEWKLRVEWQSNIFRKFLEPYYILQTFGSDTMLKTACLKTLDITIVLLVLKVSLCLIIRYIRCTGCTCDLTSCNILNTIQICVIRVIYNDAYQSYCRKGKN